MMTDKKLTDEEKFNETLKRMLKAPPKHTQSKIDKKKSMDKVGRRSGGDGENGGRRKK